MSGPCVALTFFGAWLLCAHTWFFVYPQVSLASATTRGICFTHAEQRVAPCKNCHVCDIINGLCCVFCVAVDFSAAVEKIRDSYDGLTNFSVTSILGSLYSNGLMKLLHLVEE